MSFLLRCRPSTRVLATGVAGCWALVPLAGCGSSARPHPNTARAPAPANRLGALTAQSTPRFENPSSSAPVRSGLVQVAYRNYTIAPDTLKVTAGSTVRWTNYDPTPGNVRSVSGPQRFASADFTEGATFEVKLTNPGVIHYESTTQPATMNGTIEVVK